MKRFLTAFAVSLAVLLPYAASGQQLVAQNFNAAMIWPPMVFRNTAAPTGSVVRESNWAKSGTSPTNPPVGFVDSLVFRHGGGKTTTAHYDTSVAYRVEALPFPPNVGYTLGATVDSTSNTPWLIIKARMTTDFAFAGTNGFDTLNVGVETSQDGATWSAVTGTPTRTSSGAFFAAGADGNMAGLSIVATTASSNYGYVPLSCAPGLLAAAPIINKTLCVTSGWIRFIFGSDGTGQFAVDLGQWEKR